jgi:hypothetical protein
MCNACVCACFIFNSSSFNLGSFAFRFAISSTKISHSVLPSSTLRHLRPFLGSRFMMTGTCYCLMFYLPHCLSFHLGFLNKTSLLRSAYRLVLLITPRVVYFTHVPVSPAIILLHIHHAFAVPCTISARTQKPVL